MEVILIVSLCEIKYWELLWFILWVNLNCEIKMKLFEKLVMVENYLNFDLRLGVIYIVSNSLEFLKGKLCVRVIWIIKIIGWELFLLWINYDNYLYCELKLKLFKK